MLCKLITNPQQAQPFAWPQFTAPGAAKQPAPHSNTQVDAAELERKLSEFRAASQAELIQVRQTAFQEGLRQGREEATAAKNDAAERLARTLTELAAYKRKLRADAEREVVKLSLAVARRILNRELATDADALQGIVHAALAKLQTRDIWQVRVGAEASQIAKACIDRAGLANTVKVVIDPALGPGDLLVDTAAGELDASVNTQLQEIERGFAERLAIQ